MKLPLWDTNEVNVTEPEAGRQSDGWVITGGIPEKPPVEWHNYMWNLVYKWIKAFNKQGIVEWDATTSYDINDTSKGSDGLLYASLINANVNNDPISSPTQWGLAAIERVPKTGIQDTEDWNGIAYVDPLAVGANPTAKIYPDGTIAGSTDNGSYTRYPSGVLEMNGTGVCTYTSDANLAETITLPVENVGDIPYGCANKNTAIADVSVTSPRFRTPNVRPALTTLRIDMHYYNTTEEGAFVVGSEIGFNWITVGRWK